MNIGVQQEYSLPLHSSEMAQNRPRKSPGAGWMSAFCLEHLLCSFFYFGNGSMQFIVPTEIDSFPVGVITSNISPNRVALTAWIDSFDIIFV